MKIIDYILILAVIVLLGYSIYQKRTNQKVQSSNTKDMLTLISSVQEQLQEQQEAIANLASKINNEKLSKDIKDSSANFDNQFELFSEDISSKIEKSEEILNFLMEKEKTRAKTEPQIKKKIVYKTKTQPEDNCEESKKFLSCVNTRQQANLKSCQEAKLVQSSPFTKTAEITKTKQYSKFEHFREDILIAKVNKTVSKLVVEKNCFEPPTGTFQFCKNLLCRK